MSAAHITTRERGDIFGQGSYWGPCERPGAVQNWLRPIPLAPPLAVAFTCGTLGKADPAPRLDKGS